VGSLNKYQYRSVAVATEHGDDESPWRRVA